RDDLVTGVQTCALPILGVHHYGLACDIVKDINGQPSWKGDFSILGQMAHAHRLIWGGDWGTPTVHHSFIDSDHVQRCSIAKQGRSEERRVGKGNRIRMV